MARIELTEAALAKLQEIVDHLASRNPQAAFDLIDDIQEQLQRTLGTFPDAGRRLDRTRRFHVVRNHSIVYRFDAETDVVFVLDIFGPGEDWR